MDKYGKTFFKFADLESFQAKLISIQIYNLKLSTVYGYN